MRGTVVIYDGDCAICQAAIEWLRRQPGVPLRVLAFQSGEAATMGLDVSLLQRSVVAIGADGEVLTGAHAVLSLLARNPRNARWARWYARDTLFAELSEAVYAFVACHRRAISRCLRAVGLLAGEVCRLPT